MLMGMTSHTTEIFGQLGVGSMANGQPAGAGGLAGL